MSEEVSREGLLELGHEHGQALPGRVRRRTDEGQLQAGNGISNNSGPGHRAQRTEEARQGVVEGRTTTGMTVEAATEGLIE